MSVGIRAGKVILQGTLWLLVSVVAPAAFSALDGEVIVNGRVVSINYNKYTVQHEPGARHALTRHPTKDIQRFEVRDGDFFPGDGDGVNRSELSGSLFSFQSWETIYFSLNFEVEPGEDFDPSFCVLFQLHQEDGVGDSPPLAFEFDNGIGRLLTRDNAERVTEHWSTPIKRGRYHHIVGEVALDPAGRRSVLKVWHDRSLVVDRKAFEFGYSDSSQYYWKYGIYREAGPTTFAVRFANVAVISLRAPPEPNRKLVRNAE